MTRKKTTDQAKPPATRSRKKPVIEQKPSLFGDGPLAAAAQSDSGPSLPDLVNAVAPIESLPSREWEPPGASVEDAESSPKLLGPPTFEREQVQAVAPSWLLATNHLNLLYMLAAGLVMGPAGFFGKHYRDPSTEMSGLLPIFRSGVPDAAIQQAVSEQKHLRPVIAELDLSGLRGSVSFVAGSGVISVGTLPLQTGSEPEALLIRAPLPMMLVKRLTFRSLADRKEFEAAARSFSNIDLSGQRIDVSEECFNAVQPLPWPLPDHSRDSAQDLVDRPPARGEAIGGVLAMLYQLARRSDLCGSLYRMVSGAGDAQDRAAVQRDSVLAELVPWIETGGVRPESSVQARMFWGAIQALVETRLGGAPERPVDAVLGFLDDQLSKVQEVSHRSQLQKLIDDMRSTFGLGGGTITQLFEHHRGTFSRPLLLFCLRERGVDLLEFSHPDLSDGERALAAILFGVREGWGRLPVELRDPEGLSRFVEFRMFEAECKQQDSGLSIEDAPPRAIPLREKVLRRGNSWSDVQAAALAKVMSRLGWQDCIVSRIRLPHGQYRLNISAEGVEVVVRGDIKSPTIEVNKAALLDRVSQWPPLPRNIEVEVRAALDREG